MSKNLLFRLVRGIFSLAFILIRCGFPRVVSLMRCGFACRFFDAVRFPASRVPHTVRFLAPLAADRGLVLNIGFTSPSCVEAAVAASVFHCY